MKSGDEPTTRANGRNGNGDQHADDPDFNAFIKEVRHMKGKGVELVVLHALINAVKPQRPNP
jgi:hypothetical protein